MEKNYEDFWGFCENWIFKDVREFEPLIGTARIVVLRKDLCRTDLCKKPRKIGLIAISLFMRPIINSNRVTRQTRTVLHTLPTMINKVVLNVSKLMFLLCIRLRKDDFLPEKLLS
jgi:hypothetical protein